MGLDQSVLVNCPRECIRAGLSTQVEPATREYRWDWARGIPISCPLERIRVGVTGACVGPQNLTTLRQVACVHLRGSIGGSMVEVRQLDQRDTR